MTLDVSKYLRAISSVAHNELLPVITDAYPRHRLDIAEMVLLRLIVDLESDDGPLYASEFRSVLHSTGHGDLPADIRQQLETFGEQNEDTAFDLEKAKKSLASVLARNFDANGPHAVALAPVINAIARAEHVVRARKEERIGEYRKALGNVRTSNEELTVSQEDLTRYLRKRFTGRNISVENIKPVPGGRSKGTILFTLVENGEQQELVIRKDFSKNFMGSSVSAEFPIIRAAYNDGVTVPEPLWIEEDASILNGKFIVFRRVAGKAAGTMFEIDAEPEVIRDYARQIAKLHQLNLDSAGIRTIIEFGDSEFPVRKMVMDSYAKHRARTADDLLLETAHIWMIENLDCVDRGSALVHGDAGFHNVLCEDGRMTALLDWELAHAGDPAEDLMKCKAAASQVIPWAEFMDIYLESGGRAISPERERFFTIWRMVSFSMFAADARAMFESGEDPDLRLAAVGYNTFNRLHDALARELAST